MQRNRENAQLSRQRKKQQMADLETRCATLAQQNTKLTAAVQRLTAENAMLRQQLALICQQAGRNAAATQKAGPAKPGAAARATQAVKAGPASSPAQAAAPVGQAAPPGAAAGRPAAAPAAAPKLAAQPATQAAAAPGPGVRPVATAAGAATSATAAAAAAVAARGLVPQWPLLPFGILPRVALPGQQQGARIATKPPATKPAPAQQRPAAPAPAAPSAAAHTPAPAPAPAQTAAVATAGGRAPKRARTAAGASTAFLALFTLFMFAGPLAPGPGNAPAAGGGAGSLASAGAGPQRALQALPDAALVPGTEVGLRRSGRGLQALPATPSADPGDAQLQQAQHGPLPRHPALPGADAQLSPAAGGHHMQQLLNSTLQALLLEPGNAALEQAALQRLQELGPVALLLDADAPGAPPGANPLAASSAFPSLAGAQGRCAAAKRLSTRLCTRGVTCPLCWAVPALFRPNVPALPWSRPCVPACGPRCRPAVW